MLLNSHYKNVLNALSHTAANVARSFSLRSISMWFRRFFLIFIKRCRRQWNDARSHVDLIHTKTHHPTTLHANDGDTSGLRRHRARCDIYLLPLFLCQYVEFKDPRNIKIWTYSTFFGRTAGNDVLAQHLSWYSVRLNNAKFASHRSYSCSLSLCFRRRHV